VADPEFFKRGVVLGKRCGCSCLYYYAQFSIKVMEVIPEHMMGTTLDIYVLLLG
jgi:hypothetical protein